MVTAVFSESKFTTTYELWQYDYGQTLRIQGLNLPSMVAIHFSLQESGGTSVNRVGVTKDGVTDVIIPDSMLENDGADKTYDMFAFIYLTDDTSGQTEYKIKLQVKSRPKPEVFGGGENPNIFHEAVQAVRKSADKAEESEKQAEGWAHGREDLPERAQGNAKYYAEKASEDAKKTAADRTAVESVVQDVTQMQGDVAKDLEQVQKLTGQAQTSATNAALSEQAAKTSETNAQTAQAGAETAEANAELAERNAKASEQAVEKAKQLVAQMGQEVLDNKNHVDQAVHNFDLTTQQALADVNNAGQTQTERVQGAGETAVGNIQTAQNAATKVVETAKTEAVKAVQTEGTTQTGNVTKEGEKQVQAVQAAAQEIVADREQIKQNKAGIEALKQGKADAIVETASGETIQVKDSSGLGFEGLRIFGKSTQDGAPTPESLVPIVNVGDKGTIEINAKGKNIVPFPYHLKSGIINGVTVTVHDDGKITLNGTTTSAINLIVYIGKLMLKPGDTYFKLNEFYVQLNGIAENNMPSTYIAQKDDFISIMWYWYPAGTKFNNKKLEPFLTNIPNDMVYEPYQEPQSLTISTPNGLPGIKVDSDGNYTDENGQQWICDEIDLERGKYVQRMWRHTLTKNLVWSTYITPGVEGFLVQVLPEQMKNRKILCSHFEMYNNGTGKLKEGVMAGAGNNVLYFPMNRFFDNALPDKGLANWKAFLAENPMEVITYLNTPIERDLTPEEIAAYKALHTNYPTTVISNDESAHMEVTYVADTKNYIAKVNASLQKQITELQNALISQKISGGGYKGI